MTKYHSEEGMGQTLFLILTISPTLESISEFCLAVTDAAPFIRGG